jgi:hypothetical protein
MWARSFLLRYEPSGVVGFAYRVTAREHVGASTAQVMTVTGYEQLAVVVAGATAAMAGFLGAGVHPPVLAIVLFAGALVGVVAARPRFVGGWLHDRLQARDRTAGPLRGRTLAPYGRPRRGRLGRHGLGAWALARALGATAGLDAFLLLGAFALSWLLGVLVLPLRAGRAARGLVILTRRGRRAGPATALALALRLVSFAGELVAIGSPSSRAGLARRAKRRRRPRPLRPTARRSQRHDRRRPDPQRGELPSSSSAATGLELLVVATRRRTAPVSWPTCSRRPPVDARPAPRQGRPRHGLPRRLRGAWSTATA